MRAAQGVGCLLLDYSGCGASMGFRRWHARTRWREEVLALIEALVPGPWCWSVPAWVAG
jgi:hypothetical protein